MIPVEGHRGLYRDEKSGAIINCNENEYNEYIRIKNLKVNEKNDIEKMKNELEDLKLLLKTALANKA